MISYLTNIMSVYLQILEMLNAYPIFFRRHEERAVQSGAGWPLLFVVEVNYQIYIKSLQFYEASVFKNSSVIFIPILPPL